MATWILIFKTLHIVGFTAWFAGLFYLVRMFVYHREAYDLGSPADQILKDRYALMERRVYGIICNPAMTITWIAGVGMIYLYGWDWFKVNGWLHVKLLMVILLSGYQGYCKKYMVMLAQGKSNFTSFQLRLINEVPALFLIFTVILAVFKRIEYMGYGFLVVLIVGLLFYAFAKAYKKKREIKES